MNLEDGDARLDVRIHDAVADAANIDRLHVEAGRVDREVRRRVLEVFDRLELVRRQGICGEDLDRYRCLELGSLAAFRGYDDFFELLRRGQTWRQDYDCYRRN